MAEAKQVVKRSPEELRRVKALGFLVNKGTDNFNARVITVNGKITAAQQQRIAEAAEKFGNGTITFTSRLTIEVPGVPFDEIENFRTYIAEAGLETGGTGSKVRPVVSCKGTTCQFGLVDTFGVSEELHHKFYKGYNDVKTPHKFKIGIGGCPNNCVKPDLNDLGIIGQLEPVLDLDECMGCKVCQPENICPMNAISVVDGVMELDKELCNNCGLCVEKCPFDVIPEGNRGYKVTVGGRWGKIGERGKPLSKLVRTEEELNDIVEKTILLYREQGITGERLGQTVERLGMDNINEQLFGDELMERKQEIIDAELHTEGGATC
ncbi:MAG: 4Fe-4S binding protein [Tissierellia bacterium]|jgi:dissimilatory sulfite reductase (desulfoviridin) alpha/beta subunit|nr:4Fe-4S binding protein [Bacillota bacterium]NLK57927.1 4Fe-4S binding protein [Tissierellia bacterium]